MGAQGPRSESDEHPNWNPDTRPVDLAKRISHAAAARSNMLAHRSSRTPQRPVTLSRGLAYPNSILIHVRAHISVRNGISASAHLPCALTSAPSPLQKVAQLAQAHPMRPLHKKALGGPTSTERPASSPPASSLA